MTDGSPTSEEISSEKETKTPEKSEDKNSENSNLVTPKKEITSGSSKLKKLDAKSSRANGFSGGKSEEQKTPEKNIENDLKLRHKVEALCEEEEGMISTTEQARLFIAASKTPSKAVSKTPSKTTSRTPDKQCTPSRKRVQEETATTPGKFRRVELITLSSPKVKH